MFTVKSCMGFWHVNILQVTTLTRLTFLFIRDSLFHEVCHLIFPVRGHHAYMHTCTDVELIVNNIWASDHLLFVLVKTWIQCIIISKWKRLGFLLAFIYTVCVCEAGGAGREAEGEKKGRWSPSIKEYNQQHSFTAVSSSILCAHRLSGSVLPSSLSHPLPPSSISPVLLWDGEQRKRLLASLSVKMQFKGTAYLCISQHFVFYLSNHTFHPHTTSLA